MSITNRILYFPSIEFQSPAWVKGTLLIWDYIYRIVPKDYTPNDSAAIKKAIDAGRIRDIKLEKDDLERTLCKYSSFIDSLPYMPAGLDTDGYASGIHKDKIDARLYPILDKIASNYRNEDWVHLPSELSRGYMFFLADVVAERRNLYKGTDNADAWVTSYFFSENGQISERIYDSEAEGQLIYLNHNDLIPIIIPNVPMDSILEFTEKRKDEKELFRDHINKFHQTLRTCESPSHAQDILSDYRNDLLKAKNSLRKSMDFCSPSDLSALFTVALPVAATIFGGICAFTGHPDFTALSTSLGFGSVAALHEYKKGKKIRKNNHATYLLDLEEHLAKERKIHNFNYLMDQFVND